MLIICGALSAAVLNGFPTNEQKRASQNIQQEEQEEQQELGELLMCAVNLRSPAIAEVQNQSSELPRYSIPHWRQGVYEDGQRVLFDDDWVFPYGTNHLDSVELMSWGDITPDGFSSTVIASLGCRLSQVPEVTEFYYGRTPSNDYEFVWNNARCGRLGGSPFDGRIELHRNGDVTIKTNGVATVIPREIPFAHDGFGQNESWVRANFTNSEEILSVGYANWVDAQVGYNLTNGLYKLTATFTTTPLEATLLKVGTYSVCVTNAGEYAFILSKGIEYEFGTIPFDGNVQYACADDISMTRSLLRSAMWNGSGTWSIDGGIRRMTLPTELVFGSVIWLPTLRGSPDVAWIGPDDCPLPLCAVLQDVGPGATFDFIWNAGDGITLSAYNGQHVSVLGYDMPSWSETSISVTARFSGIELVSSLAMAYGTNEFPGVSLSFSAPECILCRTNWLQGSQSAITDLEFHSDIRTNGALRLSILSGTDKVSIPANVLNGEAFGNCNDYSLHIPIDGVSPSEFLDDVMLVGEFIDAAGEVALARPADMTVVSPKRISVCGDEAEDVAVLVGTNLEVSVVTEPSGAQVPVVLWYDAKLRSDRTYTDWREWPETDINLNRQFNEPGIFKLKARLVFPGPQWADVGYIWTADENAEWGKYEAGCTNHIGVALTQAQLDLRRAARAKLGDCDYALDAYLPARYGFAAVQSDKWKCNAFVAHTASSVGQTVPAIHTGGLLGMNRYPPVANEWANGNVSIQGWTYLGRSVCPEPGMIIGHPKPNGIGHVGIVDFDGDGIAAGVTNINRQYKLFLDGTSGFNRYMGDQNE